MALSPLQPIIIKKVSKSGHAKHHGGAWKIAYADFVTAMMAFFLLLWLLNAVSQEQLEGISDYFSPDTVSMSPNGSGDILSGTTITDVEASQNLTTHDDVTFDLLPPKAGTGGGEEGRVNIDASEVTFDPTDEQMKKNEEKQFEKAKEELEETIAGIPQMKQLANSLMIDNTPEGLRIQLLDQDNLAIFPSGGSDMYLHSKKILKIVSKVILRMPQKISISGHTDAVPFVSATGYSNWELSADRANAARNELQRLAVPEKRISHIVGKAATDPIIKKDPKNARNRRISIVLLRGSAKDKVLPRLNQIKPQKLRGNSAPAAVNTPPPPPNTVSPHVSDTFPQK
jgi:chemotaxis protein MotB